MKRQILLADDDDGVRASLGQVLALEGYNILPARDGNEVLAWLDIEVPDLVLLDINMPGASGWQVLESIEQKTPMIPVIVITARPNQQLRAASAGVDALMEKPLDFPALLAAIARLLSESRTSRLARLSRPDFSTETLTSNAGFKKHE